MTASSLLDELTNDGVSVWLDALDRGQLADGTLSGLIDDASVTGVTSNPTTFDSALSRTNAYADQLHDLSRRGVDVGEAARLLMTRDIRSACDLLRPVYDRTRGHDGQVSIEVDPGHAHDSPASLAEARDLAWMVDRPNVMIKIPGTVDSLTAITAATADGLCINVTLIFSPHGYQSVLDAYLTGLEQARDRGVDLGSIRSVASFFVSRIDAEVDRQLDAIGTDHALSLRGRAGLASAQQVYRRYVASLRSTRWQALEKWGAHRQRPLWASTGAKDPRYDPVKYPAGLVADGTISTMPPATLAAVKGHRPVSLNSLDDQAADADAIIEALSGVGINLDEIARRLEDDGLARFEKSWSDLLTKVEMQLDSTKRTDSSQPATKV